MNLFFSLGSVISCHSISSIMSHSVCVAIRVTAYTNSRVAYEISALQTGKQQTRKQRSNQQQQHNYRSRLSKKDRSCSNLASSAMKSHVVEWLINRNKWTLQSAFCKSWAVTRKYNDNVKHVSSDILVDFRPTLCFLFIFIKTDIHVQHSIAYI